MRPGNWRFAGASASRQCRSWRRDGQCLEALQCFLEFLAQGAKVSSESGLAANQDIVEIGAGLPRDHNAGNLAQAAANPVTGNCVADLAAYRKPHPDEGLGSVCWRHLEDESGHGAPAPGLDAQKVSTIRQTPEARRGQFC